MTISALSKCAWLSSPASPLPSLPLQQPEALSDLCLAPSMPFRCLQAGRAPLPPLLLPFHLAPCDPALCRRNTLHKSFLWKMWRISQPLHAGWPLWQPGDSTVMPTPPPSPTLPPRQSHRLTCLVSFWNIGAQSSEESRWMYRERRQNGLGMNCV